MKIQVDFKTPDAVHYALEETNGSDKDKKEAKRLIDKFVKWGEFVSIEFDTETGLARVMQHSL